LSSITGTVHESESAASRNALCTVRLAFALVLAPNLATMVATPALLASMRVLLDDVIDTTTGSDDSKVLWDVTT